MKWQVVSLPLRFKGDGEKEETSKKLIVEVVPSIPDADAEKIAKTLFQPRPYLLKQSSPRQLDQDIQRLVMSHIRHVHTDYDALLKRGASKVEARRKVQPRLMAVFEKWTKS